MKSNLKPWLYGPDWQGQKCEALTRKGTLCQRPGNKINGRCKLHGGRSTGPRTAEGITRLAASKTTHGRTTVVERAQAKHRAKVGRQVLRELKEIETWALDHGHLTDNWRDRFKVSHCHSTFCWRKNTLTTVINNYCCDTCDVSIKTGDQYRKTRRS